MEHRGPLRFAAGLLAFSVLGAQCIKAETAAQILGQMAGPVWSGTVCRDAVRRLHNPATAKMALGGLDLEIQAVSVDFPDKDGMSATSGWNDDAWKQVESSVIAACEVRPDIKIQAAVEEVFGILDRVGALQAGSPDAARRH